MARLALTVVGGVVGSVIPGVGTAVGMAIGGAIGGMIDTAMLPDTYGPRLEDTTTSPGSYGTPIAVCYGIGDVQADVIWVKGNRRDERKNKQSSGKGGPSFVTYEYFVTMAALICDHPIAGVRRIYLGRELVYDATSERLSAAVTAGAALPLTGEAEGIEMRIYTGTATQDADPAIQGEDVNAPAWRGMSYLVFEDLPLAVWGNEIPPVFVEVLEDGTASRIALGLEAYALAKSDLPGGASFDSSRGRMFVAQTGSNNDGKGVAIEVYDMLTGQKERVDDPTGSANLWFHPSTSDEPLTVNQASPPDLYYNQLPPAVAPDGSFYVVTEHWDSPAIIEGGTSLVLDAETGQHFATLGTDINFDGSGSPEMFGFFGEFLSHRVKAVDWLPLDPATGAQSFLYMHAAVRQLPVEGLIRIGIINGGLRTKIYCNSVFSFTGIYSVNSELFFDVDQAGERIFFYYRVDASSYGIGKATIGIIPSSPLDGIEFGGAIKVGITSTMGSGRGCAFNSDANTFCVWGVDGIAVYDSDLALIKLTIVNNQTDAGLGLEPDADGVLWFASHRQSGRDELVGYSTATGEVVQTFDLTDWPLMSENVYIDPIWKVRGDIWAAHSNTGIGSTYPNQPVVFFGDRFGTPKIPLADVLLDSAQRAGMAAADLDLTAVTREIYGAPQKSASMTARGIWDDVLTHTDHEAATIDGKLTVRRRATTSSGTITEDDLGAGGAPALKRRTDSTNPFRRVELTYKSILANLEVATQADGFPVDVAPSGVAAKISSSVVMDDDEAWEDVQRLLAAGASETTEMEISLPYTRGDLELGEIWALSTDGGTHEFRVNRISGDRVLAIKGRAARPFLTPASTPIDSTRDAPTLAENASTEFAPLDAHLWRDNDDSAAFTLTAWPRRPGFTWGGGVIYRSSDPNAFDEEFVTLDTAAKVGAASNAFGDVPSSWHLDRGNSLTVRMISGAPESVTLAELVAGANPVWISCGSSNEWELAQFADAVENADGTWTLSTWIRGSRGTEHLTGLHLIGDRVIWADPATALRVGGGSVGIERFFVSATIGSRQDNTTRRSFTNTARGLRPRSVVHVTGSRNGGGDLTVAWVRRSRITGDISKTTRPLGEASEAYELDVMNGSTVVRTITASSATATYTAAQQATDFGSPIPASVTVRIYQISATFGRGVVNEVTL